MATLDIFNNDAFKVTNLTETIVDLPRVPTRIGDMGLFSEAGIATTSMLIERTGRELKLVPIGTRGAPGEPVKRDPRALTTINAVHLPQSGSVLADEVQNIRAFGSETEVESVMSLVTEEMTKMRRQLDLTLEFQRLNVLKGKLLDYDGSEVFDYYDLMGKTQEVIDFELDNPATNVRQKIVDLKRKVEDAVGGYATGTIHVFVDKDFFDALVNHAAVAKAWELYQQNDFARKDPRIRFEMAGVVFEEYNYKFNGTVAIAQGTGYAYPTGIPGMFITRYAPADYMETVNTMGYPFYAKQERMRMDRGVDLEAQSNPIHFVRLPEAVVKVIRY